MNVKGKCPMGCGSTLVLVGGDVVCTYSTCPRPDAVAVILAEPEVQHIVTLREENFTIRHPLRERLDTQLEDCALHEHIAALDGPPHKPGRYRVRRTPSESWSWEELDG